MDKEEEEKWEWDVDWGWADRRVEVYCKIRISYAQNFNKNAIFDKQTSLKNLHTIWYQEKYFPFFVSTTGHMPIVNQSQFILKILIATYQPFVQSRKPFFILFWFTSFLDIPAHRYSKELLVQLRMLLHHETSPFSNHQTSSVLSLQLLIIWFTWISAKYKNSFHYISLHCLWPHILLVLHSLNCIWRAILQIALLELLGPLYLEQKWQRFITWYICSQKKQARKADWQCNC